MGIASDGLVPLRPTYRPSRAPHRQGGFTLIELAIVLIVIAVMVGLAAPAISSALNERRANEATLDLVRLARNARSSSAAYGRAHLLRYVAAGPGRVDLYRGISNQCSPSSNPWGTITGGGCANNPYCIDTLDLADSHYSPGDFQVQLALVNNGLNTIDICYAPNGVMWWSTNGAASFSDLNSNALAGGVRFSFTPQVGGAQKGVVRYAVLPLGGDARVVR